MSALRLLKYVGLNSGYCTLTTETERQVLNRLGTDNVSEFRDATWQDIADVRSMGGRVPEGRIAKAKEQP